jgi:hypothetical protein
LVGAFLASLRGVLRAPAAAATSPRDGFLLLLSALGLGVFVVASLSLLRLVARMDEG